MINNIQDTVYDLKLELNSFLTTARLGIRPVKESLDIFKQDSLFQDYLKQVKTNIGLDVLNDWLIDNETAIDNVDAVYSELMVFKDYINSNIHLIDMSIFKEIKRGIFGITFFKTFNLSCIYHNDNSDNFNIYFFDGEKYHYLSTKVYIEALYYVLQFLLNNKILFNTKVYYSKDYINNKYSE